MRDPYVYIAQHREHREDLMYSVVDTRRYGLAQQLKGREANYIIFRFSPQGECKVIELNEHDRRNNRGIA